MYYIVQIMWYCNLNVMEIECISGSVSSGNEKFKFTAFSEQQH